MPAFSSTDSPVPAVVLAVAIALTGCTPATAPTADPPGTSPPAPAVTPVNTPLPPVIPADSVPPLDLRQSFTAVAEQIAGEVSVSVMSGSDVHTFGDAVTGPAWSTIKVPVAIAALRAAPVQAVDYLSAAITRSDNAAAESLWSLLGTPTDAALAVTSVLHDAGDAETVIQSERIRAGFTAFGQTDWPTPQQAAFAWQLPCTSGSGEVIAEMQQISPDQQWGFAGDHGVAAKGGWGPAPDGSYLVRQLALLRGEAGSIGVAMAVTPGDGTFQSGVGALNQLADWVDEHRQDFSWSDCTAGTQ